MHAHAQRIAAGEETDAGFLCEWFAAATEWDLNNPAQLEQAIRQANPAVGDFLPLANLIQRYREIPEFEYRRYHLNQWVAAPERWLPTGAWDARAVQRGRPPQGTRVALGFDGSYAGDSTALVGSTLDVPHHLFVVDAWEKPAGAHPDWRVDILDVEQAIREACAIWKVVRIGCDPFRWQRSLAVLADERLPVVEWPSHSAASMVPACAQFYEGVTNELITHDGDARLARHVAHCVVKIDHRGPRITKDHKDSVRHIDLAVAAVIAYDMAIRNTQKPSVYRDRGVRTV
jgi:phage terminase large subunit-like protein